MTVWTIGNWFAGSVTVLALDWAEAVGWLARQDGNEWYTLWEWDLEQEDMNARAFRGMRARVPPGKCEPEVEMMEGEEPPSIQAIKRPPRVCRVSQPKREKKVKVQALQLDFAGGGSPYYDGGSDADDDAEIESAGGCAHGGGDVSPPSDHLARGTAETRSEGGYGASQRVTPADPYDDHPVKEDDRGGGGGVEPPSVGDGRRPLEAQLTTAIKEEVAMASVAELTGPVWEREAERLVERWTGVAEQLEVYAPGAAAAYRQASADLRERLTHSADVSACMEAMTDKLAAAARDAVLEAIAAARKQKKGGG